VGVNRKEPAVQGNHVTNLIDDTLRLFLAIFPLIFGVFIGHRGSTKASGLYSQTQTLRLVIRGSLENTITDILARRPGT
jgi:hypothetical protein